jgi:hypothetical protein
MRKQRGISFIAFIFLAFFVAAAAILGFKVTPVYIEYYTIKKILLSTAKDAADASPVEIRKLFDKRLSADYVDSVDGKDLEITKEEGHIVLSVGYTKKLPLVANVSLLFDFQTSARR